MNDFMNVWPQEVYEGLAEITIGNKKVYTYKDMPASLYHILRNTTQKYPDRIGFVDNDGKEYSYQDFMGLVDEFAGYLREVRGIHRGCHVGMLLGNGIEFCVTYLALCKLGALVVPLPGKYQRPELLQLVDKADITFLICENKYADWFMDFSEIQVIVCEDEEGEYGFSHVLKEYKMQKIEEPAGRLEDPVILMFTSGTTSMSKGVLLKNYHMIHSVEVYKRILRLTEKDKSIVATPMYHITGLVCILALFLDIGGTLYLFKKVDPDRILKCMVENQITFYHASPTVFTLLLEKRKDYPHISSVRSFACGSGNMSPKNILCLHEWMPGAKFHTVFGMTETSGAGTIFPEGAADSPYIGSSGLPMPNLKVQIWDKQGIPMNRGEIGEVCLKGSFVLEQYYKQETNSITEDGWLRTGDLGYLNEDGYLYIVDRIKDMINRGGEKICSYDVENELSRLPGVLEAAVVALPDEKYMEVPGAMLRVQEDFPWNGDEIRDILKERMARYKIPVYYLFVDEIPKTCNGKVDKREIRKRVRESWMAAGGRL